MITLTNALVITLMLAIPMIVTSNLLPFSDEITSQQQLLIWLAFMISTVITVRRMRADQKVTSLRLNKSDNSRTETKNV